MSSRVRLLTAQEETRGQKLTSIYFMTCIASGTWSIPTKTEFKLNQDIKLGSIELHKNNPMQVSPSLNDLALGLLRTSLDSSLPVPEVNLLFDGRNCPLVEGIVLED